VKIVKSLYVEVQVWRDLAQSNEAAANVLRGELQQARCAGATGARIGSADDAESCCCVENDVAAGAGAAGAAEDREEAGTSSPLAYGRTCVVCSEGAAKVLLLPCRHLCTCASCAGAATAWGARAIFR